MEYWNLLEKRDRVFLSIICCIFAIVVVIAPFMLFAQVKEVCEDNTWQTTGKVVSVGNGGIRFEWVDKYGETRVTRYTVSNANNQFDIGDDVQLEIVYNKCYKVYI